MKTIILALSLFLIASCASRKPLPIPAKYISKENLNQLTGVYGNYNNEFYKSKDFSLWTQVRFFFKDNSSDYWPDDSVQISIDDKYILFSLLTNSGELKKEKFSYKLKNGFLIFKINRIQGVPLIFYRMQFHKVYLTTDDDKKLLFYLRGWTTGGLFVFAFGSNSDKDLAFKPLKTSE